MWLFLPQLILYIHYMFSLDTIIKGFIIGSTMMVPGVSGGSMAMVLGIYGKLITAVSSFFKDIKNNLKFLIQFSIFALIGIVLCAKPILGVIDRFPRIAMFFFIGLVFGSVPMLYKKAQIKKFSFFDLLYFIIGIIVVLSCQLIPKLEFDPAAPFTASLALTQCLIGIIVAVGFILPGISFSYLLLILGSYEFIMSAISTLNIIVLIPFGLGFCIGVILLTKVLDICMSKYPEVTYLIILGFLIGSVFPIYPGTPIGWEIPLSIVAFIVGAVIIYQISKREGVKDASK